MEKELRGKMKEGLEAYAKEMKEKMMVAKQRAIKDPRSQQERVKSGDLLAHILAQVGWHLVNVEAQTFGCKKLTNITNVVLVFKCFSCRIS